MVRLQPLHVKLLRELVNMTTGSLLIGNFSAGVLRSWYLCSNLEEALMGLTMTGFFI